MDGTITTYEWNYGDVTTGSGPTPTHVYADNGTYTVTLTVTDDRGAANSDTLSVTVDKVLALLYRIKLIRKSTSGRLPQRS